MKNARAIGVVAGAILGSAWSASALSNGDIGSAWDSRRAICWKYQYLENYEWVSDDEGGHWVGGLQLIGAEHYDGWNDFQIPSSLSIDDRFGSVDIPVIALGREFLNNYGYADCCDLRWCLPKVLEIPATVKNIAEYAFSDVENVEEIHFPENSQLKYIGERAFQGSSGYVRSRLRKINIPASVGGLGRSLFRHTSLSELTVDERNESFKVQDGCLLSADGTDLIVCFGEKTIIPASVKDGYDLYGLVTDGVKDLTILGYTKIYYGWSEYASGLTNLVVGGKVTKIEGAAFADCTNLEHAVISKSVTSISGDAFRNCPKLFLELEPGNPSYYMIEGRLVSSNSISAVTYSPKVQPIILGVEVRADDPTILDVRYRVSGTYDKVDVRALAYENNEVAIKNIIRPETFVKTPKGGDSEIGDGMTCGDEHVFSWRVASDYTNTLTRLRLQLCVKPEELLPLDFLTIPAGDGRTMYQVSVTPPSMLDLRNALLWLFASGDPDLSARGGAFVANGGYGEVANDLGSYSYWMFKSEYNANIDYASRACQFLFKKMGYIPLLPNSDVLNLVNQRARLGLEVVSGRIAYVNGKNVSLQYCYKVTNE